MNNVIWKPRQETTSCERTYHMTGGAFVDLTGYNLIRLASYDRPQETLEGVIYNAHGHIIDLHLWVGAEPCTRAEEWFNLSGRLILARARSRGLHARQWSGGHLKGMTPCL